MLFIIFKLLPFVRLQKALNQYNRVIARASLLVYLPLLLLYYIDRLLSKRQMK